MCLCVISYFMIWGNKLLGQETQKLERTLLVNLSLHSSNPSFLKVITDSVIGHFSLDYNIAKGDFVNYYSPDFYNKYTIKTESYNRLSDRIVVFGMASYFCKNGKNSGYTSFLDPYKIPFDFIEKDITTKGDSKIEECHLVGAISYQLSNKLNIGLRADYRTSSFVKLKDMRNINDILDLFLDIGLTYNINNDCLGISYTYNRYIENITSKDYSNLGNDYYALIDRGSFMGKFTLYGTNGILKTKDKRPWVDISNQISLQYMKCFNGNNFFMEIAYNRSKGYYGNDNDYSVVYMRHSRKNYVFDMQLSLKNRNLTQIISFKGNYMTLINKEQLYNTSVTSGGMMSVTNYYGDAETFTKKQSKYDVNYDIFWGDEYLKAPWHLNVSYSYNDLYRRSIYYPYFREQNFYTNNINLGVGRNFNKNKIDVSLRLNLRCIIGHGGDPKDGLYVSSTGIQTTPDYFDELLYKEKEYLTSTRLNPSFSLLVARNYKRNLQVYAKVLTSFTKPINLKYLRGDFFSFNMSLGINF